VKHSMKWIVAIAVVALATTAALSGSQEPDISQIMQRKLDHAHAILEALIVEDYETLEDSADALEKLSEDAAWFVLQTPEYTQRSTAFRYAVMEIKVSAQAKNLEGAALGYVDMTLKCVQCHELLRGTRMAGDFSPEVGESAHATPHRWWETKGARCGRARMACFLWRRSGRGRCRRRTRSCFGGP